MTPRGVKLQIVSLL